MIELYPDQSDAVDALRIAFRRYRSVCFQLPTGGGKTVIAGWLAQQMRERRLKILILVHRRELIRQFHRTLKLAGLDRDVGVVCRGWQSTPWAPIKLAMVFSWARRSDPFEPDIIIVDEGHHVRARTWETTLARYPNAKVLLLTATPKRLDGKGLGTHAEHLVCGPSVAELQALDRLAPLRILRVPAGFSVKGVRKQHGDYANSELDRRANEKVVGKTVEAYLKHIPGARAIQFAVSRRHARATAERFREHGIAAEYVGSETPDAERDDTFGRFHDGRVQVVCNVALIDEGFDVPDCEAIIDSSPTLSVTKFMQRAGRALRPFPGKTAVLVDLVGNVYRHGRPDADRTWSLEEDAVNGMLTKKETKGDGLRCCQSCLTVFNPSHAFCPHCGVEHDGRPVREVDVELIEDAGPPPKAPPKPKMSQKERGRLLAECHRLIAIGEADKAFKSLSDTATAYEYDRAWVHIIADQLRIPVGARRAA